MSAEFADDPTIREVFATNGRFVHQNGGVATVIFTSERAVAVGEIKTVVVGRVTMPLEGIERMRDNLTRVIESAKKGEPVAGGRH